MQARIAGNKHSHGKYYWEGLDTDFKTFAEFREWSIKNGYSKTNNSLDRINTDQGYTRSNCRWIPFSEHRTLTYFKRGTK